MSWKEVDNITLREAFNKASIGKGLLIIRREIKRGEKPIQFYLWVDE